MVGRGGGRGRGSHPAEMAVGSLAKKDQSPLQAQEGVAWPSSQQMREWYEDERRRRLDKKTNKYTNKGEDK